MNAACLCLVLIAGAPGLHDAAEPLPYGQRHANLEDVPAHSAGGPSVCRCRNCDPLMERLTGLFADRVGGVTWEPVYYGEVLSNTRGGIATSGATQYQGLLDLNLELDFDRLGLAVPGRFVLLAQNTHGRGLSEDFIGDFQTVSNIDSFDNIMQVSEYWWEVPLLEGNLKVRLGKQDVNTEFLLIDLAQDFIQSSFGLTPSAALPSYPAPSMAAVVLADVTPQLQLKAGLWDLLAEGGSWGFSGNEVTLSIGELEYEHALLGDQLPGAVDLGIAYASSGRALGLSLPAVFSYYIQFEQLICRENPCDEDDTQGLGVFASYSSRFPSSPIPLTAISQAFFAGVVYRGLLPGRDADVIGAGTALARLNRGGTRQETAVEVFYKAQITETMSIQPDLQYVVSPSGLYPDALVVGVRFQWAL